MSSLSRAFQQAMSRHVNAEVTINTLTGGDFEAQTKEPVLQADASFQEGASRLRQESYQYEDAEAVLYLVHVHSGTLTDVKAGHVVDVEHEDGDTETMTVLGTRRTDQKVILKR